MSLDLFVNTAAVAHIVADADASESPIAFHRLMPSYEPTPLLDCPTIATRLGVARVLVKDESQRLGLPSFKMLGASWATACAVRSQWLDGESRVLTPQQLRAAIPRPQDKRLVAATDGNHGRGVARMARLLGVQCTIFVPQGTARSRVSDIEGEGAVVHVVDGSYDDAIRLSAEEARPDSLIISDTSWEGYETTPADVARGYSTMFAEVDDAVERSSIQSPSFVAFQAGVGSFASAGIAHYRTTDRSDVVTTLIVEPRSASCLLASARAGGLTEVPPPHTSAMAGLNCGLPSQLAWPTVRRGTDVFVGIDDEMAEEAMRVYAATGIVAGESGAATLGALLAVADNEDTGARTAMGLDPTSIVLLINTEGATDPVNYERVVGEGPAAVHAATSTRRAQAGVHAL